MCIKVEKVENTLNHAALGLHLAKPINLKSLNALTHSSHPQPSGKPFGLMVNVE